MFHSIAHAIRSGFRRLVPGATLFLGGLLVVSGAKAQSEYGSRPGDFDYYVLALSWSPTYCQGQERRSDGRYDRNDYGDRGGDRGGRFGRDEEDDGRGYRRNRGGEDEQCSSVRPYAFVLHGLWPQYERRGWPEMCRTDERPWVSNETIDRMMDIMPSRRLVITEYKKHGTCSGLDPRAYFDTARRAYQAIRVPERFQNLEEPLNVSPDSVEQAFIETNPQLAPGSIQVVCSRGLLRELRVCFSKDLKPRDCSQGESTRRLCRYDAVVMPPVRGGGTGPRRGPSYGRRL